MQNKNYTAIYDMLRKISNYHGSIYIISVSPEYRSKLELQYCDIILEVERDGRHLLMVHCQLIEDEPVCMWVPTTNIIAYSENPDSEKVLVDFLCQLTVSRITSATHKRIFPEIDIDFCTVRCAKQVYDMFKAREMYKNV